ncbi:kinase-like domain-containing protein [Usnea florida]
MGSETTPSADSGHPVDDSAFVGPPSDSEDIFLPTNESFLSVNTANIDTGDDKVIPEPPHDTEEPPESSNESLALSLTDSRTSTLKYDQEPFDQYQIRVKSLCHVLWPAEPRTATLERGRLAGGTYNRVVGISVKDTGVSVPQHLILRAPRPNMAAYGHIGREVAILRYVRQHTTLPVADVLNFDVTVNNPLQSGYVIQSRLPGVSLRTVWDKLTHDQRCTAAQEILFWDYQFQFVEVAKRMDSLGILGDGQSCLCHFDLEARNIMVQILPNGSLTISGIVDWDSAVFAPTFASCVPPCWLWTDRVLHDENGNDKFSPPSTQEQEEIKEAFEEIVGFDWEWFAYREEYRLARELFHFAQHGLPDGMAASRAQKFLKEWAVLYDSLTNPKKDEESSKSPPGNDDNQEDETMDETK